MNEAPKTLLLNARRLPGRLTAEQAAVLIGVEPHDIASLIGARLLTPLGAPTPNGPKRFASADVTEKAGDAKWLNRVETVVTARWRQKNQARTTNARP